VLVDGDYLYMSDILCDGPDIVILDISDPSAPIDTNANYNPHTGRPNGAGKWGESMFKQGSLLYVTGSIDSTLEIIDMSNPLSLDSVGLYKTPPDPCDVWVRDSFAYVACGSAGLLILDVSIPSSISESGVHDTPSFAMDVDVVGDYAYVADRNSGLRVIDVSDPSAPVETSSWDTPNRAYSVCVFGTYAYVADYKSGLQIIDVSNPDSIFGIGTCDTPGRAYDVWCDGSHAYIADFDGGLKVIDVRNPALPKEVGCYKHHPYCEYTSLCSAAPYLCIANRPDQEPPGIERVLLLEFEPPAVEEGNNCQLSIGNGQLSIHPNPFTHNAVVEFVVRRSS
jgi:hypothetical protein